MKTIILRNSNNGLFVEIKTDLAAIPGPNDTFTRPENFTIMEVTGATDNVVKMGLDTRQLPTSVTAMKAFAESKNLLMTIKDSNSAISDENSVQVGDITPLAITNTTLVAGVSGRAEVSTAQAVADSSGSLNNKYFTLSSPTVNYYVWFNVSSGGTDPALSGKTGIEVAISTDDSANTIAAAVQAAVDALAAFVATVLTDTVTITNAVKGTATNIAAGNSGFTVGVTTQGVAPVAYSDTIDVEGGTTIDGSYTFEVSAGSLPAGTTLDEATGVISGTPTAVETAAFTIKVTDAFGETDTQAYSVAITAS